jgi:hypothetical protein
MEAAMRFLEQRITGSPDRAGCVRIAADFEMERSGTVLSFWFDLPESCRDSIGQSGDPWVTLMVPIAMEAGEDISISMPVDSLLLENLTGLMAVWHYWFPELREADIEAPSASPQPRVATRRGMFFSGGVDSFFTLLRHGKTVTGGGGGPVDTLIFVGGFDIPITDEREVSLARQRLEGPALAFDKTFLPVMTNLRELDTPYRTNWILSHGCAMATVAHLLSGELGEVLISSTYKYGLLLRIGSHPMTDPLLSSRQLRVIHDGACHSRDHKIAHVATSEIALRYLRVCYTSKRHDNCGKCAKCLHTMAALDMFGYANKAPSFDWSGYSMEALAGLFLATDLQIYRVERLLTVARSTGREEIQAAAQRSIDRTMLIRNGVRTVSRLPYLWRYEYQARQYLLRLTSGGGSHLLQSVVTVLWQGRVRTQ